MAFIPRLNQNGMSNSQWWYSSGNVFYQAGYGLPNCTCYAYGRFAEIRHQMINEGFAQLPTGDAKEWYPNATGFRRGTTPQLGAVICYAPYPDNNYAGHVAIVEEITDDYIVTSNSYYNGTYFATETVYRSNNYLPQWAINKGYILQGFIYNDAVSGGYSDYVISAIAGNWMQESGINPGAWEGYGTPGTWTDIGRGFGLGQWTNASSNGRLYQMHAYAVSNNLNYADGSTQLQWFLYEHFWSSSGSAYNTLEQFLNSTDTSLSALTAEFMEHWEIPGVPALEQRIAYAESSYNFIQLHKNDGPTDYSWVSRNDALTLAETQNNLMCMYFILSSGSNIKPAKKDKKSMPLWMYLKYSIW